MLVRVLAFNELGSPPSECEACEAGFFCGKCGWRHWLGLSQPTGCHHCGAWFEYQFGTARVEMGIRVGTPGRIFFPNAQDPVQRYDDFSGGTVAAPQEATEGRRALRELARTPLAELIADFRLGPPRLGRDIGPTTACFDCGTIIPVGDCFYSSTVDQRALCEGCYDKAEKAGRAKLAGLH